MSWIQLWVHLVFSTKNRHPFFHSPEVRSEVLGHIREYAETKKIYIDSLNGHKEHVHCLLSLGKEQSISKVTQLLKGESSFWINRKGIMDRRFSWQDDYWAVSVSKSHLPEVRKYIRSQEVRHKQVSFQEEIEEFMKEHGWMYIKE